MAKTTGIRACIDRVIPKELQAMARAKAVEENPANASAFEMALVTGKMWKPGRVLTVCFLNGEASVQEKVKKYAKQWSSWANITFNFVNGHDAVIRISFEEPGSWSAIGTDALVTDYFKRNEPTMNFGWLTPDTKDLEYSRVVIHEFGHALGCIHEHQNPAGGIKWNKEAVYRALGGPPNNWSKAQIDHNMFETYSRTLTQFTEFDPQSIMLYAFPKEWTLDGLEMKENDTTSDTDRRFIAARYPKTAPAVSTV